MFGTYMKGGIDQMVDKEEYFKNIEIRPLNATNSASAMLINSDMMNLANRIFESCKDSREKSLALTKLEECSMWVYKCLMQS